MAEKLSPISRALAAASQMPAHQARRVLMLICESGMTLDSMGKDLVLGRGPTDEPTEGEKHYAKREKFIKRMKSSTDRVLNYARHETLRKIEKHFRDTPIKGKTLCEIFAEEAGHPFRGNQYTTGESSGVEIQKSQKSTQAHGRGADAYRQSARYDIKIHGKLVGKIWADKAGYMQKPFWNVATINSDNTGIRQIHTTTSYEKAVQWVNDNSHHFRDTPTAIQSAESGDAPTEPATSLAARLTFDKELLSSELLAALREDQESALSTAGQQLFDEIGKDSVWRLPSQDAIQFVQDRANLLANVPDEVHTEIMQSIEQGLQAGESRKELMARISAAFDEIGRSRAETIANTETAAAFNYSRDKAMREAGVTHKKWLHSQSPLIKEPRPTHLEADGQVQPIDEPFDVGGVQFMRPADDSLGAGPEDIINCHCVAIPVEAPLKSSRAHIFKDEKCVKCGIHEVHANIRCQRLIVPKTEWKTPIHPKWCHCERCEKA
jgi:hypothetical protein